MDNHQPRKQGGSGLLTFVLVLVILFLSGVLIYMRYGDLILNRLYQFTDGKVGVETGVTALPGREDTTGHDDGDGAPVGDDTPDEPPADGDGETPDDTAPEDTQPPEPPEPVEPEPPDLDYAAASVLPEGLTLSTNDFTLRTIGESATVRVTGGGEGPFTWLSQNPDVAAVDQSGKITAVSHGTVNVIVTDGTRKGTCVARMITGTAPASTATLNTTDFTRTVEEGEYQLKIEGVDAAITWTSDNEAVATVDSMGLVTPTGRGRANIRASWDGGYLICIVRVPG